MMVCSVMLLVLLYSLLTTTTFHTKTILIKTRTTTTQSLPSRIQHPWYNRTRSLETWYLPNTTNNNNNITARNTRTIQPNDNTTETDLGDERRFLDSVCACQPSTWEFTLDFSRTSCYDISIRTKGQGVAWVSCTFTPSPSANPDNKQQAQFDVIHQIQIREYNTHGEWLNNPKPIFHAPLFPNQDPFPVPLHNGQSFKYTSVLWYAKKDGHRYNVKHIPSKMEVRLIGENKLKERTEFHFILYFSNDCFSYPVVVRGDYVGPVIVVRIIEQQQQQQQDTKWMLDCITRLE